MTDCTQAAEPNAENRKTSRHLASVLCFSTVHVVTIAPTGPVGSNRYDPTDPDNRHTRLAPSSRLAQVSRGRAASQSNNVPNRIAEVR
jgi:hypothetical protein